MNTEQGSGIVLPVPFLQINLAAEKRRILQKEDGKCRQRAVLHVVLAVVALAPAVRQLRKHGADLIDQGGGAKRGELDGLANGNCSQCIKITWEKVNR